MWYHPQFLDYAGAIWVACLVIRASIGLLRYSHGTTKRKDVFWAEFWGFVFGGLICAITLLLKGWFHPNLAGALLLNGGVAFVLRAMIQIIGTWVVFNEGRIQGVPGDTVPMSRIQNNTLIPALSRSLWLAAGSAAALANGDVEPSWLEHWAIIALVAIMSCTYMTKLESTHTPIAIWSQLTEGGNKKGQGH